MMAVLVLMTVLILAVYGIDAAPVGESFVEQSLTDIVDTEHGQVQGLRTVLDESSGAVNQFLGIPFAAPPVGALRFRHPVDPSPWVGVYNATSLPQECPQIALLRHQWSPHIAQTRATEGKSPQSSVSQDGNERDLYGEDCLYLNLFAKDNESKGKAVLVWIYGGGYTGGGPNLYDPSYMVTFNDVVVVALTYRLGALGFMSLNTPEVPGNAGMMDQIKALKWVQNNIANFGGDPNKVTIFGESAGAGSTGTHLVSPLTTGLFSQAIMQSGGPLNPFASMALDVNVARSRQMAESMGCDTANSDLLLQCLLEVPENEFLENLPFTDGEITFRPTVDGYYLTETPETSIENGNFQNIPIMIGANANEGSSLIPFMVPEYFQGAEYTMNSTQFRDSLQRIFSFYPSYPDGTGEAGVNALLYEYTNWENIEDEDMNVMQLSSAFADREFICDIQTTADRYSEAGNHVYFYHFTERFANHVIPEWMGVIHTDELHLVFGQPYFGTSIIGIVFTEMEKQLSFEMMKHWTNFAKTGDPNIDDNGEESSSEWPLYTRGQRRYKDLNSDDMYEDASLRLGTLRSHQCGLIDWYLPLVEEGCP